MRLAGNFAKLPESLPRSASGGRLWSDDSERQRVNHDLEPV